MGALRCPPANCASTNIQGREQDLKKKKPGYPGQLLEDGSNAASHSHEKAKFPRVISPKKTLESLSLQPPWFQGPPRPTFLHIVSLPPRSAAPARSRLGGLEHVPGTLSFLGSSSLARLKLQAGRDGAFHSGEIFRVYFLRSLFFFLFNNVLFRFYF